MGDISIIITIMTSIIEANDPIPYLDLLKSVHNIIYLETEE